MSRTTSAAARAAATAASAAAAVTKATVIACFLCSALASVNVLRDAASVGHCLRLNLLKMHLQLLDF